MVRGKLLFAGLLLFGCNKPMPQTEMVAVQPAAVRVACAADADCGTQQLCVDRMCYDVTAVSACSNAAIHFVTNSAAIDSRNRGELNQAAACLRSDKNVSITLGGNADERGKRTYNRDLAQRRADAVAAYLESVGVPSTKLVTLTYGVDNPLCTAHDSACWQKNRRVDIAARGVPEASVKNKNTTDNDTKSGVRIDSTGNGTDNATPLGK
jgi:outer membrane protein OmpA-like peptidoglycan-associated protein